MTARRMIAPLREVEELVLDEASEATEISSSESIDIGYWIWDISCPGVAGDDCSRG